MNQAFRHATLLVGGMVFLFAVNGTTARPSTAAQVASNASAIYSGGCFWCTMNGKKPPRAVK